MNRAGRVALLVVCAVAVFGAGFIALLVLRSVSDDSQSAREQVTTVKKDATTAKNKATANDKKVSRVAKTAKAADARSKGTVKFLQGKQGSPGRPGIDGTAGPVGAQGPQGPPGRNAVFPFGPFLEAVSAKLAPRLPSAEDVVKACGEACVGPTGEQGQRGEQGPPGADGAPGPQGIQGDIGPQGPVGPQGPPGNSPTQFVCQPPAADGTQACTAVG